MGAIFAFSLIMWLYGLKNSKYNGKLPQGSMGFPILGETRQFFAPNSSFDISPFIKERILKY